MLLISFIWASVRYLIGAMWEIISEAEGKED